MAIIVVMLTVAVIVLFIALICTHLINKSLELYLKKIGGHPTDEELNACVREVVRNFME